MHACAEVHIERSGHGIKKSVPSFHHMSSGIELMWARLSSKNTYVLGYLLGTPTQLFLKNIKCAFSHKTIDSDTICTERRAMCRD